MTAPDENPAVNEIECSWADLSVTMDVLGGATVATVGFKSIKYGTAVERGESRGLGGRVRKRTAGQAKHSASVEMEKGAWALLRKAIKDAAKEAGHVRSDGRIVVTRIPFDMLIQWTPLGADVIHQARLEGLLLDGRDEDLSDGPDPNMVSIPLNPAEIVEIDEDGDEVVFGG